MGEVYNMSNAELSAWRQRISDCLKDYKTSGNVHSLFLFLIWLYEYVEASSVNGTGKQAKLKHAKSVYITPIISTLFHFRGRAVHRPYSISNDEVVQFYNENITEIRELLNACGIVENFSIF